jgi:hypothetical protein
MNRLARALLLTAVVLAGCRATRDVAVTSYHVTRGVAVGSYRVATAPVHYALRKRGEGSEAVTTETISSDVPSTAQSAPVSEVNVTRRRQAQPPEERSSESSARTAHRETPQSKPKTSSSARASSTQPEFPTANAVPGKPGYVVSPFDSSGRYVDVSGYASGTKVKDPWTDKIFIVP